jgi:hypothetical protein
VVVEEELMVEVVEDLVVEELVEYLYLQWLENLELLILVAEVDVTVKV